MEKIIEQGQMLGIAGEKELILTIYLLGTSRLLHRPLACVVMGASSAGKSYVIGQVTRMFPEEAILQAHRLTPRALEHMPAGSLVHRFVVAGERSRAQDDQTAEATRALREMISDGRLTLALPVKNHNGVWETVHIQQEGPIAYVESTTLGVREIFDEDRTRFVLLSSDERKAQTEAVINQLAQSAANPGDPDTSDSILALHHTAQRLLEPGDVVVPFAEELKTCLPLEQLEVRRTFGHLLNLIKVVALLHQYQREHNEQQQIIALPNDYDVVRYYLSGPLARSLGKELTPGAADLLEGIGGHTAFTIPELTQGLHLSENTVRSRVKELVQAGQVVKLQAGTGRTAALYQKVENPPPLHGLNLPRLNDPQKENGVLYVDEFAADNV